MHVQLFDIRTMQFSPLAKSWLVDSNFRRTRRVQRYHRSSLITKWADMLFNRLVGMISDLEISGDGDSNSIKESESLKVLRAVRVLRPLKIVSGIPSEWNMCSCCHWVIRGWSKNTSLPALTNQRNHYFYNRNWVHIHIQVFTQSNSDTKKITLNRANKQFVPRDYALMTTWLIIWEVCLTWTDRRSACSNRGMVISQMNRQVMSVGWSLSSSVFRQLYVILFVTEMFALLSR